MFSQNILKLVAGEVKFFSQPEMMKMIIELKAVTGRWPMPNDVEDEEDFRSRGGVVYLTYAELVELNHVLLVTGRRSPNGHFGAADITTTSHWVSNSLTRTRPFSTNSTRPLSQRDILFINHIVTKSAYQLIIKVIFHY